MHSILKDADPDTLRAFLKGCIEIAEHIHDETASRPFVDLVAEGVDWWIETRAVMPYTSEMREMLFDVVLNALSDAYGDEEC